MTQITMETPLSALLTNKRRVSALKSLGITTVNDALTYYPFRVTEPVSVRTLNQATIGEKMACIVEVLNARSVPMNARRGYRCEITVSDERFASAHHQPRQYARLIFFSHRKSYVDWLLMRLQPGTTIVIAGEPSVFNEQLQFTHPEILTVNPVGVANETANVAANTANGVNGAADGSNETTLLGMPTSVLPQATRTSALKYDADTPQQALARVTRPRPVYHASSRISSDHIHETILGILREMAGLSFAAFDPATATVNTNAVNESGANTDISSDDEAAAARASLFNSSTTAREHLLEAIPDILPDSIMRINNLMHRAQAFSEIHDPDSTQAFKDALHTMRFEEAFVCQTALLMARDAAKEHTAIACTDTDLRDEFIDSLPFTLTDGQRTVIDDISADMATDHPMQRLLQGEVGSGKTVVALAAMLQAVGSGKQAVLVAPTQVLAEQHYRSISKMVPDVNVILLTGGMKLAARRRALATAASGEPCIVVATHAAFSKTFQAPELALAVIDEQHRFGVEQRETLRSKGTSEPHLLVMTATPIPRTAAMTWFGDLDISWLTELPGGRKPIRTFVIPELDGRLMAAMFTHIRQRIDAGERAFIVCPRIDADDDDDANDEFDDMASQIHENVSRATNANASGIADADGMPAKAPLHSVTEIADRLASLPQFKGIEFAQLTGRDDDETKTRVMDDFISGKTPVLVATTVIEVGVDVPLASCIVIFNADRFGLSQLHQLRGRVGRGGTDSWAFLVSEAEPGSIAEQRLQVIAGSLDGAEIAQADLELRGAGDVLGDAQSGGKSSLKLLRVVKDAKLISEAREQAEHLLSDDPKLEAEDCIQLAGAVLDFTRGNEAFLTSN